MVWLAWVSLSCIILSISGNDRLRMKMDFTWKFILGESEFTPNCSNASFPINMMNKRCDGLSRQSATTLEQCIDACCADITCGTYQWCTSNKTTACKTPPECWIGSMDDCSDDQGWISMGRPTPAPYNPPIKPDYNDSSWRIVNVPHDFIVETGAFNPNNEESHGYLPKNVSWYRKYFKLDSTFKGKSIWIDFDGVYRDSDLYLNGEFVGNHASGYTSFRYYLNQLSTLQYGDTENVFAMRVDPTQDEGWWYEGGGIYRHVWLNIANPLHIKPYGVYAGSNVTNVINTKLGDASLDVQTNITYNTTSGSDMTFSLQTEIVELSSGKMIAQNIESSLKLSAGNELFVSQKFSLQNVLLWGIFNPEMYIIYSTILDSDNNIIDSVETKFGFRRADFDPNKGLILNGEFVKMNGFCNHQDFAGSGIATPERVNRYRVQKLQEMGANAWRMSHNPPNPELLDFTDEYGMLVWDENRHFSNNTQYLIDQADMINRDKNHPSIVIWSLCNEGGCMEGDADAGNVGKMFKDIIYRIDNVDTRPVSAAMNHNWGDALSPVLDIQGINYNEDQYDPYHAANPNQPIVSSENHIGETARGEYVSNATAGHSSSYDNVSSAWMPVYQRSFVAGVFFWTGFDYKGEPKPYGWPEINSQYGTMDICGFEKDVYWYYRTQYQVGNESIIYVFPDDWNQWKEGADVNVWIYSNVEYVDLQLNGKSVSNGMQKMITSVPTAYKVNYTKGTLQAIGYDSNKNNIHNYTLKTSGDPYAIELKISYPGDTIYSDGQDVALIEVKIIDNMGIRVPTASNMITFDIEGDGIIFGVGNGDNACHEPDKSNQRSAFHGLARVIVQSILDKPGEMKLTASSKGLLSDSVKIYTVVPPKSMLYL